MKGNGMERKPYKPPKIRKVALVAEEAVLLACKTSASVPGQVNKDCSHQKCQVLGS